MHVTRIERMLLAGIMDAIIPAGGEDGLARSAGETGAVEVYADMVRCLPLSTALGLRAAVFYIEYLGPFTGLRRPGRFSWLTPKEREECLAGMYKSPGYLTRQMVLLMKSAACMAWGADEDVRDGLGMNRPPRFVDRGREV